MEIEVLDDVQRKRTHQITVLDLTGFEKKSGFRTKSFSVVWAGSTEELSERLKELLKEK